MSRGWRTVNWVMLVAFVLSIAVQYNDPDPFLWVGIWGAAATACALELRGQGSVGFPSGIAIITFFYAVHLAPAVLAKVPFLSMFGAWEMADIGIEQSREFYGLLWITAWMIALAATNRRRSA
jgi:hypothetical protein